MAEDIMEIPGINSHSCSSIRDRRFWCVSGVHEDILNISPQISYHNPAIHPEKRLRDQNSMSFQEMASVCSSRTSISSTETPVSKSVAELVKEISTLELEVIHLEQYLLSLYRTAFDRYLASSSPAAGHASRPLIECYGGHLRRDSTIQISHQATHSINSDAVVDKSSHPRILQRVHKSTSICRHSEHSPAHDLAFRSNLKGDIPKSVSGHQSLADHLGASITDHVPEVSCKLSEDIIRCISVIYCRLANPPAQHVVQMASLTPSMSSCSTFSPQDPSDNWSPRCPYEATASPSQFESLKDKSCFQYSGMVEVPQIRIDGDKFGYASKTLNIFRSLIQRLENIDPRKMEHDEQLAFWINIHNALVMHAFLAFALRGNHMKSTYSILKAAYNIGGHSINAYAIQSSILGCQSQHPALWLRSLFSPAVKFMNGNIKHPYALDHPEPLAHFALSSGACSDPPVRLYTARGINKELQLAKAEFIRANISVRKAKKIALPKILYYYAKDACIELAGLMKMVCDSMPDEQQKAIKGCLKRRLDKCIEWSPYKSTFRYLVHSDLVK